MKNIWLKNQNRFHLCYVRGFFLGLKFNMEFLRLPTSKISICKEHMIQGPPVQLYRDNLRTHVPMCEDYLQKGKNSLEIERKGKTENWSKTVARGVVQSLGQMAAINVFHYSIVKQPLLFCSWQSFVPSKGNIGIIFPHSLVCFSIF